LRDQGGGPKSVFVLRINLAHPCFRFAQTFFIAAERLVFFFLFFIATICSSGAFFDTPKHITSNPA